MSKKEYKFTISGVSIKDVMSAHFGDISTKILPIRGVTGGVENDCVDMIHKTKNYDISHLSHEFDTTGKKAEYFVNSKKKRVKLWPTMIDAQGNFILPQYTTKPCRNCHQTYTSSPIGCPVNYVENIDENKKQYLAKLLQESTYTFDSYFETEHMFCEKPCIKSYVLSCLSRDPMSCRYNNALTYLSLFYKIDAQIEGRIPIIPCAPEIEVLELYGGHLNADEFRASTGLLEYKKGVNSKRPLMISCIPYIEES
jgi:hypothetical protein